MWNSKPLSLSVEMFARGVLDLSNRPTHHSYGDELAIYDSDSIRYGSFVEVMMKLFVAKQIESDETHSFAVKCNQYRGKSLDDIGKDISENIFEEFKQIFNSENGSQ